MKLKKYSLKSKNIQRSQIVVLIMAALVFAGCGPSSDPFDETRVLDVRIELDPGDWETLRSEGRGLPMTVSGCQGGYEYTYFQATATVNGEEIANVGIRKKGYLGSLSALKPSLKINFGKPKIS